MSSRLSWPSLYNPSPELRRRVDSNPTPPGTHFLHNANDIFRFTLYWTLIFNVPPFLFCGICAFLSLYSSKPADKASTSGSPLNRRTRRLVASFALCTFLVYAIGFSVVSSLVVGYGLAGFYSAGNLNLSTWVPFLWGLIQAVLQLIGIWPGFANLI